MTKPTHRRYVWWTRLGVATGALALVVLLGRVVVTTPSAEAHADAIFTVLYSFNGADGGGPDATLARDAVGNLYGTTAFGGAFAKGTVFKLDTAGAETVLYSFIGGPADGYSPSGDLVRDAVGNFYGTTPFGGSSDFGTVFKLDTTGAETVLHSFTGVPDGRYPIGLVRDSSGNLYGTTQYGGAPECTPYGCGTVFKLDTTGKESVLYSFAVAPDGQYPLANLVRDASDNLYGTTANGGAFGFGTVFEVDPAGAETVLYSFTGNPDGANPFAGLILDAAGNLYGTTQWGGAFGAGTVFKLDTTGTETVLHSFMGVARDGKRPMAGLLRDPAGNLYGTTGGGDRSGTAFKLDTTGKLTILHRFTIQDGAGGILEASLIRDAAGNLYGTTPTGGAFNQGMVYKLSR